MRSLVFAVLALALVAFASGCQKDDSRASVIGGGETIASGAKPPPPEAPADPPPSSDSVGDESGRQNPYGSFVVGAANGSVPPPLPEIAR
jgi:hypothetical protein